MLVHSDPSTHRERCTKSQLVARQLRRIAAWLEDRPESAEPIQAPDLAAVISQSESLSELVHRPTSWSGVVQAVIHGAVDVDEIPDILICCSDAADQVFTLVAPHGDASLMATWAYSVSARLDEFSANQQSSDFNPESPLCQWLMSGFIQSTITRLEQ